jgi:hypothetical protein
MAKKEEIIAGLQFVTQEAARMRDVLSEDEWSRAADMDGWKNKQILAHLAGVGGIVIPFAGNLANAAPGADGAAGVDIDALNAAMVAQRADKSVPELVDEIATNYTGVADWLRNQPDELLAKRVTIGGYKDVTLGDLLVRMVVLHGLGHIYSSYSAIFGPTSRA